MGRPAKWCRIEEGGDVARDFFPVGQEEHARGGVHIVEAKENAQFGFRRMLSVEIGKRLKTCVFL